MEHASCFRAGSKEETREAFQETKLQVLLYDFMVRGRRYRGSTQETKSGRAVKAASLKLASVIEGTDPLPSKPSLLSDFAERFHIWVEAGRLEEKTKKFYRNGWRLLKATPVAGLRVDQVTGDFAEQFKFPGSAANANCALRTLRRMLHKAEEWKMIDHAPKIKMLKEHGRHLRLMMKQKASCSRELRLALGEGELLIFSVTSLS